MTIATELDQLLQEAQDKLPANPLSRKNLKLADDFERDMSKYFKALSDGFPYKRLDKLYYKYAQESLPSDEWWLRKIPVGTRLREAFGAEAQEFIEPFLRVITQSYLSRFNGHLSMIYMVGSAQMMEWAGVPYEGPPMQQAINYASKRAGWLIKNMNTETVNRLKTVISNGIANKRGVPGITSDLRHTFTDMSSSRAKMIARTETSDALSQAFMDRAKDMKIEAKEWVTSDPCRICAANEGDGVIPIDEAFSSGDMRPPAHPNCRCSLAPARLK